MLTLYSRKTLLIMSHREKDDTEQQKNSPKQIKSMGQQVNVCCTVLKSIIHNFSICHLSICVIKKKKSKVLLSVTPVVPGT